MVVVRLREPAVLAEVVEADDLVAGLEQLRDEVAGDEPGGAGDEDAALEPDPLAEGAPDVDDVLAADRQVAVRAGAARRGSGCRSRSSTQSSVHEPVVLDVRVGARTARPGPREELAQLVAERRAGVVATRP